mgnify:CR=1 FL=1
MRGHHAAVEHGDARARFGGGNKLLIEADLKRGGYSYVPGAGTMAPIGGR